MCSDWNSCLAFSWSCGTDTLPSSAISAASRELPSLSGASRSKVCTIQRTISECSVDTCNKQWLVTSHHLQNAMISWQNTIKLTGDTTNHLQDSTNCKWYPYTYKLTVHPPAKKNPIPNTPLQSSNNYYGCYSPSCSTQYRMMPLFQGTISDWNRLPQELTEASTLDCVKFGLISNLNSWSKAINTRFPQPTPSPFYPPSTSTSSASRTGFNPPPPFH